MKHTLTYTQSGFPAMDAAEGKEKIAYMEDAIADMIGRRGCRVTKMLKRGKNYRVTVEGSAKSIQEILANLDYGRVILDGKAVRIR